MRIVLRHTGILLLELLAGLLAVVILAGGVLAVLLKGEAPLQLAFLTPYLEQGLNEIDPNIKLKIGETLLTWSGWEHPLDLRARNVQVSDTGGHSLATLPDISLELSVPALLMGEIAPGAIEVVGPKLIVVRTAEGRLQLGFGASEQEAAQPLAPDLAAVLLQPASGRGHLSRISVRQATVVVIDRRVAEVWRLPTVNFELRRSRRGAQVAADATLLQRTVTATLSAKLSVPANGDPAAVNVEVAGLDPRTLAVLTGIPEVERLRLTVGGALSGLIERSGQVREVKFALAAGPGAIDLPELYPEPLPVAGANLRGRLFDAFDRLELDAAALTIINGPTLTLSGAATGLSSPDAVQVQARLASGPAPTEAVLRYWPTGIVKGTRTWIEQNIAGGSAEEGQLELALTIPRDNPENTVVEHAEGAFRASGLTVTYLKGLPPLQGVSGEGKFHDNTVAMTVSDGHIGKLVVTGGTVDVASLDTDPQIVTIDGRVKGPLRDALLLIDHDPLGYPRKVGIDPKTASGSAEAHLWFRLPATKDVGTEEVELRVEAKLADLVMTDAAFGAPVRDGSFDLTVERPGMTLTGTAVIANTATRLEWRENFGAAEFDTRIAAEAAPDGRTRAALGLHTAPWVEGPTPLQVVYTRNGATATASVTADLTQATLAVEPIGWRKKAGIPGQAHAIIALHNHRDVAALTDVVVDAGDLSLAGSVSMGTTDGAPTRIALNHVAWGGSRLEQVDIELGRSILVRIAGGVLDAGPFLEHRKDGRKRQEDQQPGPAFHIQAPQLAELRTGADRTLAPASLDLANNGDRWQAVAVTGGMPGGKAMSLQYGTDPATGHRFLRLSSDDAGALLRTTKLIETVVGGTLTIEGEATEPGLAAPLPVRVEVQDYRVVRGRVMAKILQQAKLEDINKVLAQEGIPFSRFTGKMVLTDGAIAVEKARAYGAALGITGQGKVDLDGNRVDIEGTIVPAYVVSQIVGAIPLIGRILTGGEGEGLFAATYRAKGPLDDPQVSVNPLAALAPGFLRGLFNIFDGSGNGGDQDFTPLPPQPDGK